MKLYREVRIETADDLDQLEEYYVKETSPGGAWQIVLVPIEAEEETREHPRRHEKAPRAGEAYLRPATMTRLVTPWEEA